ncbi:MAG TPA: endo-1,4-beta-xylanase [Verrucomicrobiae bacterium]|nr:endo-1,4-beta-xylanase [Verrucomicrobiae bacterium]
MKNNLPRLMAIALTSAMGISASVSAQPTLKETFKNDFLIGVALNESQFTGRNEWQAELAVKQFNSITPENVMKWENIHPRAGEFDFDAADKFVAFGEQHGMFIVGHTLIWHSQTPRWVFEKSPGHPADRETLLARMSNHIHAVVGRYKGRVKGWDVVNEALNEDGSMRQSPWMRIIGEDYLLKAFEFAHQADPNAELYYNDFSLENPAKRKGAMALIEKLKAAGAPITGLGTQMHIRIDKPETELIDQTLTDFRKLGVKVMVTELDVDVLPSRNFDRGAEVSRRERASAALNPYTNGLPAKVEQELADRYAQVFGVFLKHRDILERVTFWGVTDGQSWLNNWPIQGRTSYPLLFDRKGLPKSALDAVIQTQKNRLSAAEAAGQSS